MEIIQYYMIDGNNSYLLDYDRQNRGNYYFRERFSYTEHYGEPTSKGMTSRLTKYENYLSDQSIKFEASN